MVSKLGNNFNIYYENRTESLLLRMVLDNIKKIRTEKGISHEAMVYNQGITQTAYTKIERNETKLSVERLYKIAEILDVEVSDLLGIEI